MSNNVLIPYNTVETFCHNKDIAVTKFILREIGMTCTSICEKNGITINTIPHEEYGKINAYPEYIILKVMKKWTHH